MNVREQLMKIREGSINQHIRNLGGRGGDDTDEEGDLIFQAMDRKKECSKRRRIFESESDENVATKKNGVEQITGDEVITTRDTDAVDESQPIVVFPGKSIEDDERVPPSRSFRTSTQKELAPDPGGPSAKKLTRPPLSEVQGLSPIAHHRPLNTSEGARNEKSPASKKRATPVKKNLNEIHDPRIVSCSVVVDKLPLIVLPPSMLTYPTSDDEDEEEEPKERQKKTSRPRHKLFSEKILEPGSTGSSGNGNGPIIDTPKTPTHSNSILLRNLRQERDPDKRIFGDTYSQSRKNKSRMPTVASSEENPTKGPSRIDDAKANATSKVTSGKVNNIKANASSKVPSESGDSDFEALAFGTRKKG